MLCIAEDRWGRVYLATGRGLDLWCASMQGISRFTPAPETPPQAPPPVFIQQVRVRGLLYRSWDLGAATAPKLTFAPAQNQLQIDFAGLAFTPGRVLRYQYKLEPADRDWSGPSEERSAKYSDVAPGSYRFSCG